MKIISVEGLDKAGKHSATQVLFDYFTSKGLSVAKMSFPDYKTPTGKLVKQWLNGEYLADAKTFELLQAADKQAGQTAIAAYEQQGIEVLLIDRYIHSLLAYGAYDNDDLWLKELSRYLRKPDYTLYLDVEPEVSMHRRGKFGDNDYYESDLERLRYTKDEYRCVLDESLQLAVRTVDANVPQVIVKAQVLRVADDMLMDMFPANASSLLEGVACISLEEAEVISSWKNTTGNQTLYI